MVCHTYILFFTQIVLLYFFRTFFSRQHFHLTSKIRPICSASVCPPFSKSPTTDWPQWSTKDSIYPKKSLNFQIIIKRPSCHSIGLRSNIIYGLFIVDRSYKYQIRNVSTQFQHFGLSVISCTVLIANWEINRNKILLFLHLICLYTNVWTIYLPKYYIIIYTI